MTGTRFILSRVVIVLGLSVVGGASSRAASPNDGLLAHADFESGDLSQLKRQQAADDSITLVTTPVRAGKFAARTLSRATDRKVSNGQRAEFSDRNTPIEMNKDYWYGLSTFVPEDFVAPQKQDAVLFQWHTQQGGPSPVLSIRVQGGDWLIVSSATAKRRALGKRPLVKGRWTDWVIHAKWAADATGFWTIWKDGVEVVSETNVVTQYPEKLGPYAKFGQYHSVQETTQNVVYVDEYRVAGPGGSYETVAPPRTVPIGMSSGETTSHP
jgi:hypothetical protein